MVVVASIDKIEKQARNSPDNISYSDMLKLCTHYFGEPRSGPGKPQRNLQNALAGGSEDQSAEQER